MSTKHVLMAKRIAKRWIERHGEPEFRFRVLYGAREIRNLPNLMRSFRDGKVALEETPCIPDMGIKESFDALEMWSRNRESLICLKNWFEKKGFETTGVW